MILDTPTGPFLDRLFGFFLPGGRKVAVTAFSVVPSNIGILEGGLSRMANSMQREKIRRLAAGRYGEPLVVVEPTIVPLEVRNRERLPWMACMAQLTSTPVRAGGVGSTLTLVWWQDAFESPLPLEIERAAAGIDWETSCKDYDLP